VVLIRPSKYDDDGYVVRHWRGTLPSNTLACLNSLTEDVVRSGELGAIDVRVETIDETVTRVDAPSIGRRYRREDTKVVVGLAGVQTNQFPRAHDLACQFKAEGFDVIIGGFHVSGAMAMSPATPPECQELMDAGITLVLGEVEGRWSGILQDAVADRLQPLYDFLAEPPDLAAWPLPRASRRTQKKFVVSRNGTIDAGRGCPFFCSFCTIINVQGRKMRSRGAEAVLAQIRENYGTNSRGVRHYFFTDDNFSRNPQWEAIFDGLIAMREAEGLDIDFMMQVDTQAASIPRFVEKAARAGCVQVFVGIESVRDDNLKAGGKPQNKAEGYREMVARWHEVGVVCHAGFIIGFPYDTYERVMEDVRALAETILVDHASFFMLMPIPGSRDHLVAMESGAPLDPDYNNYDSCHATSQHPRMSRDEWQRAFRDAWTEFYSPEHMRRALLAQNPHTYWGVLKNYIWYRASMIEGAHPMLTGFFRRKDRRSRRATFQVERRWPFFRRRAREVAHVARAYAGLYLEMQELWLQTRIRRDDYWFLGDLRRLGPRSLHAVKLTWGRVHAALPQRIAALQAQVGAEVGGLSATLVERIGALSSALGSRAAPLRSSVAERADAVRFQIEDAIGSCVELGRGGRKLAMQAALADLRLQELPSAPPPWSFRRQVARVNPFSLSRLEHDPTLTANLLRMRQAVARLQFWRVNPLALAFNAARRVRQSVVFLIALAGNRY
jgi:radical SAM superfamily enzyme YgiQ (UPF0313 family)